MFSFVALISGIGYLLSYYLESREIFYIFTIACLAYVLFSYKIGSRIILKTTGAKKIKKEDNVELWNTVENLAITAGIKMPKVCIIEESSPNAYATGTSTKNSTVVFTRGLLDLLDKNEVQAVAAHEISHIKNKDILVGTLAVAFVGVFIILADIAFRALFLSGSDLRKNPAVFIGIIFLILSPIFAKLIQLAISRKREFLADSSAVLLTRYPDALASALEKIEKSAIPMKKVSKSTEHLYISNPFRNSKNPLKKIFSTHPPTEERVKNILGK